MRLSDAEGFDCLYRIRLVDHSDFEIIALAPEDGGRKTLVFPEQFEMSH
jgi:hypothetical protein